MVDSEKEAEVRKMNDGDEVIKLKKALRWALVLMAVLVVVLAVNGCELIKYREISSGDYVTVQECTTACHESYAIAGVFPDVPIVNINLSQIGTK